MVEITFTELILFGVGQAIIVALIAGIFVKSKNIQIIGPLILWRSKLGIKFMDDVSKKFKGFWRSYGDFGIILAFGFAGAWYVFRKKKTVERVVYSAISSLFLMAPYLSSLLLTLLQGQTLKDIFAMQLGVFGPNFDLISVGLLYFGGFALSLSYVLTTGALSIIEGYILGTKVVATVGPAIPGVDVKGSPISGIPWYGWFVFPLLLAVHEVSHGILARLAKFKVNNTGLVLFGILPFGAFVEPDEKKMKKGHLHDQLRVYSVGSTANYLTAFIGLLLLFVVVQPVLASVNFSSSFSDFYDHPEITLVFEESNALGVLQEDTKILSINGNETLRIADVHAMTAAIGPNGEANIRTSNGTFAVRLSEDGLIGVGLLDTFKKTIPLELTAVQVFVSFISLTVFFNFVVGIMNLLPMYPLDGGQMLEAWLKRFMPKKKAFHYTKLMSIFLLLVFLVNLLPLIFPTG